MNKAADIPSHDDALETAQQIRAAHGDALRALLGADRVVDDPDVLATHGKDWTKAWQPAPSLIIFPRSVDEVQALVRYANEHSLAVVPSGGRTGLSGAAVAINGELVVSFDRMNKIHDFNAIDGTVVCEAGVITEALQNFAEEQGLFYPVDFASAGSSQIGGNIATNAGGNKVIRYGMTRQWVMGLTVVTGSGEILELNRGLVKNNAGYDLRQLFIGSEGTLGLIVDATIQLTRPPQNLTALVLGVPDFDAMMAVFRHFNEGMPLTAFEFFSELALQKVVSHTGLPRPFAEACPYYALIEFEAPGEADAERAMSLFESAVESGWVLDGVMSQSIEQLQNLWRLREDISETISTWTPYKNDISSVVSQVPSLLASVEQVVTEAYPDFEIVWFGHIGDGNVHLNILKPDDLDVATFHSQCHGVSPAIFDQVKAHGGSVSAEHGVGLLKKDYLGYSRSEAELALMRGIKQQFDPNGIMNPGKVL